MGLCIKISKVFEHLKHEGLLCAVFHLLCVCKCWRKLCVSMQVLWLRATQTRQKNWKPIELWIQTRVTEWYVRPVDRCGVVQLLLLQSAANDKMRVHTWRSCGSMRNLNLCLFLVPPITNVCIFHSAHHRQATYFLSRSRSVTHSWTEGDVRLFSSLCDHSGVYSDEVRSVSQSTCSWPPN